MWYIISWTVEGYVVYYLVNSGKVCGIPSLEQWKGVWYIPSHEQYKDMLYIISWTVVEYVVYHLMNSGKVCGIPPHEYIVGYVVYYLMNSRRICYILSREQWKSMWYTISWTVEKYVVYHLMNSRRVCGITSHEHTYRRICGIVSRELFRNKLRLSLKSGCERERKYYEDFFDWFVEEWNFTTVRTAHE